MTHENRSQKSININKADTKMKQNLEKYYYLCMDHKEIMTIFYDYYMDFSPVAVKKIFRIMFVLNKAFRLLLTYCLFYHTIWWLPNSTSKNLAINYSNINPVVFFMLVHYNFYQFSIYNLILKRFCNKIKFLRDVGEFLVHIPINVCIFYYLRVYLRYELGKIIIIILPHLLFVVLNSYDVSVRIFKCNIFTNHSGKIFWIISGKSLMSIYKLLTLLMFYRLVLWYPKIVVLKTGKFKNKRKLKRMIKKMVP